MRGLGEGRRGWKGGGAVGGGGQELSSAVENLFCAKLTVAAVAEVVHIFGLVHLIDSKLASQIGGEHSTTMAAHALGIQAASTRRDNAAAEVERARRCDLWRRTQ